MLHCLGIESYSIYKSNSSKSRQEKLRKIVRVPTRKETDIKDFEKSLYPQFPFFSYPNLNDILLVIELPGCVPVEDSIDRNMWDIV
jgi:hypothetical protein